MKSVVSRTQSRRTTVKSEIIYYTPFNYTFNFQMSLRAEPNMAAINMQLKWKRMKTSFTLQHSEQTFPMIISSAYSLLEYR
jgi:hypothetical protein